jgi:hypothetical protein
MSEAYERDREKLSSLWEDRMRWSVMLISEVLGGRTWQVVVCQDRLLSNSADIGSMFTETLSRRSSVPGAIDGAALTRSLKELVETTITLAAAKIEKINNTLPKNKQVPAVDLLFEVFSENTALSPFAPEDRNVRAERQRVGGVRPIKTSFDANSPFYPIWKLFSITESIMRQIARLKLPADLEKTLRDGFRQHVMQLIAITLYYERKDGKDWAAMVDLAQRAVRYFAYVLVKALPREQPVKPPGPRPAVEWSEGEWKVGTDLM